MNINITICEQDLKKLVKIYIENETNMVIDEKHINIMVKSKQNYKSEWEQAEFKAEYIINNI